MTNMWLNCLFIIYCSLISLWICRVETWSGHVCTRSWITYFTEQYCASWWTGVADCKYWKTRQSSKISYAQYCCDGWTHNGNEICTIFTDVTSVPANTSITEALTYANHRDKTKAKISLVKRQESTCGEYLTAKTTATTLTYPIYHSPYQNNLRCNWTIEASANYVIVILITYLDLEANVACSYDYLSINLGRNPNLETNRICTNSTKDLRFISRSNQAIVSFVTDVSVTRTGFSVQYHAVLNCGQHLTAHTSTSTLTSPLYPSQYDNNLTCHWTIEGPVNSTIVIEISYVDLEETTYCFYDYLQIYIVVNYIFATDRICSKNMRDINYISRSNVADVIFVTDTSVVKTGFSLQYHAATNCGGRLASEFTSSTLSSPYYPHQYDNNLVCHWTIEGSIHSRIEFEIVFIDIEESSDCTFDYLQIIYMGESTIFETGRICRYNQSNLNIITRSNKADVIFVTDESIKRTGFSLNYKSVTQCGGYQTVQNTTSPMNSPGYPYYYESNLYCLWTINGGINSRIVLNITYIDIQGNDDGCPYDFLQIYLGYRYILKTKRLCGNNTKGLLFISGSNEADVIFVTDGSITKRGFSLQFTAASSCGGHLSAGTTSSTLYSPNYPLQYNSYLRCHWTIDAPINYRIVINITDVDLDESDGCSKDYLQIYLGDNYILEAGRICSKNSASLNSISMSNEVHVIFITDGSVEKRGFSLQYQSDAQVIISTDSFFAMDGETVNLKCSVPSFIVPASWIVNNTGVRLSTCLSNGSCSPPNDTRYVYSATSTSIGVTIASFNVMQDTFGWTCQYGNSSAVFVIKPKIPVTTVEMTNTSGATISSTINVVRGGSTDIRCSTAPVGSSPRATFRWYKRPVNQLPILIGTEYISSTPDAIMVTGQPSTDLVISFSTLKLTGDPLYQNMHIFCEARDGTNTGNYTQSREFQINIVYTATITEFVAKDNVYEIMENNTLELYCRVDSNPNPEISIFFDDVLKSVSQDTNELIYFATAGCFSSGTYICSATNSVMNGVRVSADVNLNVLCRPRLDYRKSISKEYYVSLNDNVTLVISVIAYPEPTDIMWYHMVAETGLWQQVLNKTFLSTGLHSNIIVHIRSQSDFGDYLVNMSNSVGTYEHIFHVIPEVAAQGPSAFQVGPIVGGVLGAGAMVAVICISLVIIFKRRRNLRNKESGTPSEIKGSTNEIIHGRKYEELHVNMTGIEPYLELADISRSSGDNVRNDDSGSSNAMRLYSNAGLVSDNPMNQEILEGENVIYENTWIPN